MPISPPGRSIIIAALLFLFPSGSQAQTSLLLEAVKDNTLYESAGGLLSNGVGSYLFAGRTGTGAIRRALVAFEVDGILPLAAAIDSVQLILVVSRAKAPASTITVHRAEATWGESTSNAVLNEGQGTQAVNGDATWLHTSFPGESWSSPGGDFDDTPSASLSVGAAATYTWRSTERLTDDVRDWSEHPERNFGWLIRGDETASSTATRFNSRENPTAATRPLLRVYYSVSTANEPEIVSTDSQLITSFPNPFSDRTTIRYEVGVADHVTLEIFDALGRHVETLVSSWQPAGLHEVRFDAPGLGNGLYLVRMSTRDLVSTGNVLLVR